MSIADFHMLLVKQLKLPFETFVSDLNDVFYLASGRIKRKFDKEQLNSMTGLEPVLFQPSDPYSHIQHPYYEENSAPLIQQVEQILQSLQSFVTSKSTPLGSGILGAKASSTYVTWEKPTLEATIRSSIKPIFA